MRHMPTPNLSLVPLEAAQSQKHITVNEALARLDAAAQLTVADRWHSAPPNSPQDGERYLVSSPASEAWAGQEDHIAIWDAPAQGWAFLTPKEGWRVWIADERILLIRGGWGWIPAAGSQLGINATPDTTNRLAVSSQAILLNHDGASIHAKLNKASAADTAALLFQTGYSGRAELGLTGDDDFHLKTSTDGGTFHEAMTVEAATGIARFPAGINLTTDPAHHVKPDEWRPNYEAIALTFADAETGGNESPTAMSQALARRLGGEVSIAIKFDNLDITGLTQTAEACLRTLPTWARPRFGIKLPVTMSNFNASTDTIALGVRIKANGIINFYETIDNAGSNIATVDQFKDDLTDFLLVGSYPGALI